MTGLGLPPTVRIKKRSEFLEIQKNGEKLQTKHFLLLVRRTDFPMSRIGVTITTKVDKRSVNRNRLRRRVREIFRLNRSRLALVLDLVVIARSDATKCSFAEIEREILGVLTQKQLMRLS